MTQSYYNYNLARLLAYNVIHEVITLYDISSYLQSRGTLAISVIEVFVRVETMSDVLPLCNPYFFFQRLLITSGDI